MACIWETKNDRLEKKKALIFFVSRMLQETCFLEYIRNPEAFTWFSIHDTAYEAGRF